MNASVPEPDFKQRQRRFADQIRNPNQPLPEGIEPRRMQVYTELFFNNLAGFLEGAFPVYRSLCSDCFWADEVRGFMQHYSAQSPLFRDLAQAYREYVEQQRPPHVEDPPFLQELLHYEWVELALDIDEADPFESTRPSLPDSERLLREHPRISPLAWSFCYHWPVHQICRDYQPMQPPEQPSWLLVYRTRHDEVKFMELNAVSARLLWLLSEQPGISGARALEQIATGLDHLSEDAVIQGGLQLLHQFAQHDIVLGTTACEDTA